MSAAAGLWRQALQRLRLQRMSVAAALLLATPFFVVFGSLSDRIGRKKIVLAGCLLAAVTYVPIFKGLTHYANPAIETASAHAPVTVVADPNACSFQFDPVGKKKFVQSCDIAKSALAKSGVPYRNEAAPVGSVALIRIGDAPPIAAVEGGAMSGADFKAATDIFSKALAGGLKEAGYPAKADPAQINYPMVLLLLWILVLYVTMVYGPIAAWLIELFPARIRYTSMSLPYHIGNGIFGGFLPLLAAAIVVETGNIYAGLYYPIGIAAMSFIIGSLFIRETKGHHIRR